MDKDQNFNGILIVNKDTGFTSRDVVNKVSKILKTRKVGHTGTLDPLAKGVLVLTIGKYTKLSNYLTSKYKTYIAEFDIGYETDTLDSTGLVVYKDDKVCDISKLEICIKSFVGTYLQEVPKYSAVKVNGKRLYDYARNDIEVDLPSREVDVKKMQILFNDGRHVKFECTVSKGTYIRSLIRDIGRKMGSYATMTDLTRTKQGEFCIEDSYSIEDIKNNKYKFLDDSVIFPDMEEVEVQDNLLKLISNGCKLNLDFKSQYVKFLNEGKAVAIYIKENEFYKMFIKF